MNPPKSLFLFRNWLLALSRFWPLPAVIFLPRYLKDRRRFLRMGGNSNWRDSYPCLLDRHHYTPFDPHYFFQAAWLARRLVEEKPQKHVDVGSDIRMINVLSAFVPTEFFDYRPLSVTLSGLTCRAGDIATLPQENQSVDSLSCLHVIEHVGLGRYGEPVDPEGSRKAASELERILAPGGNLYVSTPVGRARVCFNAHRIFDPVEVQYLFPDLKLIRFTFVDDSGQFRDAVTPKEAIGNEFACGMYIFSRPI